MGLLPSPLDLRSAPTAAVAGSARICEMSCFNPGIGCLAAVRNKHYRYTSKHLVRLQFKRLPLKCGVRGLMRTLILPQTDHRLESIGNYRPATDAALQSLM